MAVELLIPWGESFCQLFQDPGSPSKQPISSSGTPVTLSSNELDDEDAMLLVIVVVLVVALVVMMMMIYVLPLFSSNKLDDDCSVGGDCGGVGDGGDDDVQAATLSLRYSCVWQK